MISSQEAVQKAANYLQALIPTQYVPVLEELEHSEDAWYVTLSFVPKSLQQQFIVPLSPPMGDKQFKIFKVDGTTGDILSMKIREFK